MSQLGKFSFKEAARIVLKDTGVAMTPKEIIAEALKRGLIERGTGKTPETTMGSHIYTDIRGNGENSYFRQAVPGVQKFIYNDPSNKKTPPSVSKIGISNYSKKVAQAMLRNNGTEMTTNEKNILYIAKNHRAMPGYIKIGVSDTRDTLPSRIRTLSSSSNVPFRFKLEWAIEIKGEAFKVERLIKKLFHEEREDKRSEFYHKDIIDKPEMKYLQKLLLRSGGVELDVDSYNKEILSGSSNKKKTEATSQVKKTSKKKSPSGFDALELKKGDVLNYRDDNNIICKVYDDLHVEFRGEIMRTTGAARKVRRERGDKDYEVNGYSFWKYQGELLTKRRIRLKGN